jgi:hypothetical protein
MRKQTPLSLENFVYENDEGELIFPEDLLVDDIKIETEIENEYYDDGKYSIVLKCGYQIITDSKIEAHQELKELFKFYYMQQEYKLENH